MTPERSTGSPHADKSDVLLLDRAPQRRSLSVVEVPRGKDVARSLAQLGVSVNEKLRVRSAAPWGGPILVEVGGTTVAISRSLASHIKVRLIRRDGRGSKVAGHD